MARVGRKLAVAIFDLGRFKTVNDTYGHRVGDRILVSWAEQLKSRLRESDIVCRYGGDEFAAILPGSDRPSTENLLSALTNQPIELSERTDLPSDMRQAAAVRVSWGVAHCPVDGTTAAALVEAADARLLMAKRRLG